MNTNIVRSTIQLNKISTITYVSTKELNEESELSERTFKYVSAYY